MALSSLTQRSDSKQDGGEGEEGKACASCRMMVNSIGKIHHVDLRFKAFGWGQGTEGRGEESEPQKEACLIIAGPGHRQRCLLLFG